VKRIEADGGHALALPGDMTVEAEAIQAVEDTVARLGRIDILINSAGVIQGGGIENCDVDDTAGSSTSTCSRRSTHRSQPSDTCALKAAATSSRSRRSPRARVERAPAPTRRANTPSIR
jgi:NAD(P)-dependent dehydrogenase (short-subunit alcohol dehydrogenase family)